MLQRTTLARLWAMCWPSCELSNSFWLTLQPRSLCAFILHTALTEAGPCCHLPPAKYMHVCCSDACEPCQPLRAFLTCAAWLTQSVLPCTGRRMLSSHMGTSHHWQWHGPIGSWGWHRASCRQLVRTFHSQHPTAFLRPQLLPGLLAAPQLLV